MIKLVAADLDGTCLKSDNTISDKTIEALNKTIEKGIKFVPATGRTFNTIPKAFLEIPGVEYVLYSSGAVIKNLKTNEIIHDAQLPKSIINQILNVINNYDLILEVYVDGEAYIAQEKLDRITDFETVPIYIAYFQNDVKAIPELELQNLINNNVIEKMNVRINLKDEDKKDELMEQLRSIPGLSILQQVEGNIEITNKEAVKGLALKTLSQYLDINPEEILALGDSENDISMLEFAGLGVAMGQASEEVKNKANYVSRTNDDDGVEAAIEKLVLDNKDRD